MPRDKHNRHRCLIRKQHNRLELADSGVIPTNHVCMTGWLSALIWPFMRTRVARFLDTETTSWKAQP